MGEKGRRQSRRDGDNVPMMKKNYGRNHDEISINGMYEKNGDRKITLAISVETYLCIIEILQTRFEVTKEMGYSP